MATQKIPPEIKELLSQVANMTQEKMGTHYGKRVLLNHLIEEWRRHTDKEKVKRG